LIDGLVHGLCRHGRGHCVDILHHGFEIVRVNRSVDFFVGFEIENAVSQI